MPRPSVAAFAAAALACLAGTPAMGQTTPDSGVVVVRGISAGDLLNLRATASPTGIVLGRLPNGTALRLEDCDKVGGYRWCRVEVADESGLKGWTPARYLHDPDTDLTMAEALAVREPAEGRVAEGDGGAPAPVAVAPEELGAELLAPRQPARAGPDLTRTVLLSALAARQGPGADLLSAFDGRHEAASIDAAGNALARSVTARVDPSAVELYTLSPAAEAAGPADPAAGPGDDPADDPADRGTGVAASGIPIPTPRPDPGTGPAGALAALSPGETAAIAAPAAPVGAPSAAARPQTAPPPAPPVAPAETAAPAAAAAAPVNPAPVAPAPVAPAPVAPAPVAAPLAAPLALDRLAPGTVDTLAEAVAERLRETEPATPAATPASPSNGILAALDRAPPVAAARAPAAEMLAALDRTAGAAVPAPGVETVAAIETPRLREPSPAIGAVPGAVSPGPGAWTVPRFPGTPPPWGAPAVDGFVVAQTQAPAAPPRFDATGAIPCARYLGQPMTRCEAGVTRTGPDASDITVNWPDGGTRIIRFRDGQPEGANTRGEFRFTREADLHMIRIGTGERVEIPDALAFGE